MQADFTEEFQNGSDIVIIVMFQRGLTVLKTLGQNILSCGIYIKNNK